MSEVMEMWPGFLSLICDAMKTIICDEKWWREVKETLNFVVITCTFLKLGEESLFRPPMRNFYKLSFRQWMIVGTHHRFCVVNMGLPVSVAKHFDTWAAFFHTNRENKKEKQHEKKEEEFDVTLAVSTNK